MGNLTVKQLGDIARTIPESDRISQSNRDLLDEIVYGLARLADATICTGGDYD